MQNATCVSCRTLAGQIVPPGGIVYDHAHWLVFLRSRPLLKAGQGFIVLKRHCEDVGGLTAEEAAAFGEVMRRTALAYTRALAAERVHFGLYAEDVRHVHVHVLPRTRDLPAGNIPTTLLGIWYAALERLRLRRPYDQDEVARAADALRLAYAELQGLRAGIPSPPYPPLPRAGEGGFW